ncbi:MAG: uL22 family ribosomal protein [Candidatus Shikimatogenerans bostrichidophilus]|nr:MAG: uL22 family ribosomal protein [Candidatus Shikimatogenerans bostrichidophilus]
MGKRKRISSIKIKEKNIKKYFLVKNVRISPKKIIFIKNIIKGKNLLYVINIIDNYISIKISKIFKNLILSVISNYKIKKKNYKFFYINNVIIGSSGMVKRFRYASQGRYHKIRKRLSNIKLEINKNK